MNKHNMMIALIFLVISFTTSLPSLACDPYCPKISPPPPPPSTVLCPPPPQKSAGCPIHALKLDACMDLLGGLMHLVVGDESAHKKCCSVIEGLAEMDAALCFCTTIRLKMLNMQLVLPIALELMIDCGKRVPADYQCPSY